MGFVANSWGVLRWTRIIPLTILAYLLWGVSQYSIGKAIVAGVPNTSLATTLMILIETVFWVLPVGLMFPLLVPPVNDDNLS